VDDILDPIHHPREQARKQQDVTIFSPQSHILSPVFSGSPLGGGTRDVNTKYKKEKEKKNNINTDRHLHHIRPFGLRSFTVRALFCNLSSIQKPALHLTLNLSAANGFV
jgi:hypothetical protein